MCPTLGLTGAPWWERVQAPGSHVVPWQLSVPVSCAGLEQRSEATHGTPSRKGTPSAQPPGQWGAWEV